MSVMAPAGAREKMTAEDRRVLTGTMIGTTIEWYDFFIYAQAAGLVFAQLYFAPLGQGSVLAQMVSWASLGISFLFRPLGAVIAGHFGDQFGRKKVLVATLILMGAATTLIGILPTHAQIGITAPLLLVLLRIIQGISAGGEWGGAALMAVEHAPVGKRGIFGSYPQIGVPAGMILATLVVFIMTSVTTPEQFLTWGWRIPFLFSVVMIIVGYFIRRAVSESPVFQEMAAKKRETASPLRELIKRNPKAIVLAALVFIGSNAAGYLLIAFLSSYAIRVHKMDRPGILLASTLAGMSWLVFTMVGGHLSDRWGRIKTVKVGYILMFVWMVPLFLLIDAANVWLYLLALVGLTIGNGLTYGPLSALFAEMFPAEIRYSGISIAYAIGAILGGAFAPLAAEWLLGATQSSLSIAAYIMILCIASYIGAAFIREPKGIDLVAGASSALSDRR
ncbi:Inner membrane metabolite transport protein YhjE [Arthrobacter sp. Bi26]|nr:Inner membrane metabolite transport protein YhjE [Arthrobacter sp. Bi26]